MEGPVKHRDKGEAGSEAVLTRHEQSASSAEPMEVSLEAARPAS